MAATLAGLIPLIILGLITWAIGRWIKRTANAGRTFPLGEKKVGVGGWLLFIILGLVFLGPLMGAGRISNEFQIAEQEHPALIEMASWATYKTLTWWGAALTSAMSIYTGFVLIRGRTMADVRRAIIYLWLLGPVAGIVGAVVIQQVAFGRISVEAQGLSHLIASMITTAIWTAYLVKSKRVRATYSA